MNTLILLGILAFLWPANLTAAYGDHIKIKSSRQDLGRLILLINLILRKAFKTTTTTKIIKKKNQFFPNFNFFVYKDFQKNLNNFSSDKFLLGSRKISAHSRSTYCLPNQSYSE